MKGFRSVQGTCVAIPGFLDANGQTYSWKDGYRWVGG